VAGNARLMIQILGDSSSAVAAMGKTKTATQEAGGAATKTGTNIAGVAKAVATGYAVTKVMEFGKSTVEVAGQAIQANHRLEQVFRGAGDTTGTWAQHAEDLASSLGRNIGVSPTVIKNAESILATFHAVSGETGMQAGIFDRATKAAADLSAAGFGDMSGNAKLLGKALQDPTQGMGALRRAGVNFSAAQIEQIKHMQESGDLLGAQKLMLQEVEGQVKGTAAATAGAGAKQKVAYEEMQTAIGTSLLPAVKVLRKELTGMFNFVSANASWLIPLILALTTFAVTAMVVSKAIQGISLAVKGFTVAINIAKTAWMLLNLAFAVSPIGVIIVAILAVIAILVILYFKVDWFRNFVNTAMADIVGFFVAGWNMVVEIFNAVTGWISSALSTVEDAITWPFKQAWKGIQDFILTPLSTAFDAVTGWISSALSTVENAITWPFKQAWKGIQDFILTPLSTAFNAVTGWISSALSTVENAITAPFKAAWDFIDNNILGPLKSAWNGVANTINAIHVSFTIPSNAITDALHIGGKGFDWSPPFHIPTLQSGGLLTRSGLIYAHAGEAIIPAPVSARARGGPLVEIAHAHFSERIDADTFGRRLAWTIQTAGV